MQWDKIKIIDLSVIDIAADWIKRSRATSNYKNKRGLIWFGSRFHISVYNFFSYGMKIATNNTAKYYEMRNEIVFHGAVWWRTIFSSFIFQLKLN